MLLLLLKLDYLIDMNFKLRKAELIDIDRIWILLQQGIAKRKQEGSEQWQDGYPNRDVVLKDITHQYGIVLENESQEVVAYIAMIDDIDTAYEMIEGKWLSHLSEKYMVFHRLIVDQENSIRGLATWFLQNLEPMVLEKGIHSIKVDTNFDNVGMLRVFEKLGYQYCGKVYMRGKERLAFEKLV